jgi:hypothetical protein
MRALYILFSMILLVFIGKTVIFIQQKITMKKIFVAISLVLYSLIDLSAQSTAPNWTLDDCNAVSHTLHNYLDSQEVVVMEFAMGCASCTQAAGHLMNLKDQYAISHPGKVNWFYMDYWGNTCVDVNSAIASFNFDAGFINCQAQKDDYYPSIFPMPAIIIAAGNFHTVIYQSLTWYNSDTALIKTAIDQFFNTVGVEDNFSNEEISIYPNPAKDVLNIDLSGLEANSFQGLEVYDIQGKKMKLVYQTTDNTLVLAIGYLPAGNYIVEITTKKQVVRKMFVKD